MTEVEVYTPSVTGAGSIVEWANAASAALRLVTPLVQTAFVPEHFRGQIESATAAVLFGAEVGLTPLQSLQGVYVISGKPAMYARTMLAVTQARGHEVWTEELADGKAVVCGRRKGSQHVEKVVWTVQRAQKAGYTRRNPKYESDPQAMLLARAQAEVCRRIAADALLGMAYAVEELEDETAPTETRSTEGPKKMRRAAPAAAPEPSLEPDEPELPVAEPQEDEPEGDPRDVEPTRAQLTKLNILLEERGLTERPAKLAELSQRVGRDLSSSKDLTRAEASNLIDEFSAVAS